jgi:hypothetical protein
VPEVLQFLRIFLDIVLWRRGPQDLPASQLLVWLTLAAYVTVSVVQLALLDEPVKTWFFFLVVDPVLLMAWVWLVLKLFGHPERYVQTVSAVLGTGALLGLVIYLPLQFVVPPAAEGQGAPLAQVIGFALVAMFALVTGRIIKLATDSSLFTGIGVALTYFLVINFLLAAVRAPGP